MFAIGHKYQLYMHKQSCDANDEEKAEHLTAFLWQSIQSFQVCVSGRFIRAALKHI